MEKLDRFYDRIRQSRKLNTFVILTRYLIGFAFIPSGFTKLMNKRFTSISIENPVGFFFEGMYQAGFFWQFIGFMQIFAAFLLMTQYFTTLGALVFLPMMTSIFVITISMQFKGTWLITLLMLLANLLLLAWDYHKLKYIFYPDNFSLNVADKNYPGINKIWRIAGLILFIISLGGAMLNDYFAKNGWNVFFMWMIINTLIVLSAWFMDEWNYRKRKTV